MWTRVENGAILRPSWIAEMLHSGRFFSAIWPLGFRRAWVCSAHSSGRALEQPEADVAESVLAVSLVVYCVERPSTPLVITSKAANGYQFKTGRTVETFIKSRTYLKYTQNLTESAPMWRQTRQRH